MTKQWMRQICPVCGVVHLVALAVPADADVDIEGVYAFELECDECAEKLDNFWRWN